MKSDLTFNQVKVLGKIANSLGDMFDTLNKLHDEAFGKDADLIWKLLRKVDDAEFKVNSTCNDLFDKFGDYSKPKIWSEPLFDLIRG